MVMTEAAANCLAEQISDTDLGRYRINKRFVNDLLHNKDEITSSSIADRFPLFEKKLGPNKPLRFDLSYKNMKLKFKESGDDVNAQYLLGIQVFYDFED
jgi:hypothetical protein